MDESLSLLLYKLVWELGRAADQLLHAHVGISYKRIIFLFVLQHHGTITQHELAVALGYSDPAVSTMLLELTKDGYTRTIPSPEHGRKRLVTLTPQGSETAVKGRQMLDSHFDQLMITAGVDAQQYNDLTKQIYQALVTKTKKEQL